MEPTKVPKNPHLALGHAHGGLDSTKVEPRAPVPCWALIVAPLALICGAHQRMGGLPQPAGEGQRVWWGAPGAGATTQPPFLFALLPSWRNWGIAKGETPHKTKKDVSAHLLSSVTLAIGNRASPDSPAEWCD